MVRTRLEELHEDELTLGDVEFEPTWVAVRTKLAHLFSTTATNFYPVLPVVRDRDDVKQVLVLRMLADLLRSRIEPRLNEQYQKMQLLNSHAAAPAPAAVDVTVVLGTLGEWAGVPVPKKTWNTTAEFKSYVCNQIGKPERDVGDSLQLRRGGQTSRIPLSALSKLAPGDTIILELVAKVSKV